MKHALRIQKKSDCTRRDFRKDTGRSSGLEIKRSGMELGITNLRESGIRLHQKYTGLEGDRSCSLHECQCLESWNHFHDGCDERRTVVQNHTLRIRSVSTEQFRIGAMNSDSEKEKDPRSLQYKKP